MNTKSKVSNKSKVYAWLHCQIRAAEMGSKVLDIDNTHSWNGHYYGMAARIMVYPSAMEVAKAAGLPYEVVDWAGNGIDSTGEVCNYWEQRFTFHGFTFYSLNHKEEK